MTGVSRVLLVARRELIERARSRMYVVTSLLTVAIVVAMILGPTLLNTAAGFDVGIVGTSATLERQIERIAGEYDAEVALHGYAGLSHAEAALDEGDVDAVIVPGEEVVWQETPAPQLAAVIGAAWAATEAFATAEELGLSAEEASRLVSPAPLAVRLLQPPDGDVEGRRAAAMVGMVLLFMAINMYGSLVLTGVVEEKSSRVVEVLLARIPPRQLLAGKVLGIGLLGFAQVLVLLGVAIAAIRWVPDSGVDLPAISLGMGAWLLLWFALGFAFYSCAYGALGALASRTEDAQSAVGPLTFVFVAAYFFAFIAVQADPGSVWSVAGSFVPLTAPLVVPMRIAVNAMSGPAALLAVVTMVLATWALIRLAGRVYSAAVLRTGPRIHLRDALHMAD